MKSKHLWFITTITLVIWGCKENHPDVNWSTSPLSASSSAERFRQLTNASIEVPILFTRKNPKRKEQVIQSTTSGGESYSIQESYREGPSITLESLYREMDVPVQTFTIQANEDNMITGNEGTVIFIPKNSFAGINDKENATVSVEVKEYYGKSALLYGNLGTISNNQLIESGGTIYIEASQNGEKLDLKSGKTIDLTFPASGENYNDDMQLFTGNKTEANPVINWQRGGGNGYVSSNRGYNPFRKWATPSRSLSYFKFWLKNAYQLPKDEDFKSLNQTVVFKFEINAKGKLISISTDSLLNPSVEKEIMPILHKLKTWTISSNIWNTKKNINEKQEGVTEYLTFRFKKRKVKLLRSDYKIYSGTTNWRDALKKIDFGFAEKNRLDSGMIHAMNYAFSSNKMGWINCDRFLNENKPLANITVPSQVANTCDYKLVFKNINSIMPAWITDNGYEFYNIPVGYEAKLLAIEVKDNKIFVGTKDVICGNPVGEITFIEITKEELKNIIENLNI